MKRVTRKIEFDAGHRLVGHESKCRNLHGHRYVAEIEVGAEDLDEVGRVIDFGVVKQLVGGWVDEHWDHGMLINVEDKELVELCRKSGWKHYVMCSEPTAENLVVDLFARAVRELPLYVKVLSVRLYETPNCWADYP